MGVPALFRWLSKKYGKIVSPVIEDERFTVADAEGGKLEMPVDITLPNPNGTEFDCLYLDMNGIVHPCTHPEGKPAPETEEQMMVEIFKYTERIVNMIRPRRLLFMAIDGVAPRAKMNQQRSRRFRSAQEAKDKAEEREEGIRLFEAMGHAVSDETKNKKDWDSNAITPGTPFMKLLATSLRYWVVSKLNSDPGWKNMQVIISDASVPGEGEHKIMDFIRRQRVNPDHNPNTHHVIYGLDADLIMLSLATHEPHFRVLREDVFAEDSKSRACRICGQEGHFAAQCTGAKKLKLDEHDVKQSKPVEKKPFIFLDVAVLREYLEIELNIPYASFPFDLERAIDDWIFMIFFVGNDFLPHMPSLEIREGAIDTLLRIWKRELPRMGGYLTDNGHVVLDRVQVILEGLAKNEDDIFRRRRETEERQDSNAKRRRTEQEASANGTANGMQLNGSDYVIAPVVASSAPPSIHPSLPARPSFDIYPTNKAPTAALIPSPPVDAISIGNSNHDIVANRHSIRMANMNAAEMLKAEMAGLRPLGRNAPARLVSSSAPTNLPESAGFAEGAAVVATAEVTTADDETEQKEHSALLEEASEKQQYSEGDGQLPVVTEGTKEADLVAQEPGVTEIDMHDDMVVNPAMDGSVPADDEMDAMDTERELDAEGEPDEAHMDRSSADDPNFVNNLDGSIIDDPNLADANPQVEIKVPNTNDQGQDPVQNGSASAEKQGLDSVLHGVKRKAGDLDSDDILDVDPLAVEDEDEATNEPTPHPRKTTVNADGTVDYEDTVRLWEPGYKERYYQQKFNISPDEKDFVHQLTKSYIEGLAWVLHYYYQGTPSWQWYYPYHYAPFAQDFEEIGRMDVKFEQGQPFKPFEQLMGVFPAASRKQIPTAFHRLMTEESSPIIDFYPTHFEIDMNGKKMAWQGVALLPFIDPKRLLEAMAPNYPLLTEEEVDRNKWGNNVLLVSDRHRLYEFLCALYAKRKSNTPLPIDTKLSSGIAGSVLADPDCVPGSTYFSPLSDQGLSDIQDDHSLSVLYFYPKQVQPHRSVLLRGVRMATKTLTPQDQEWIRQGGGGRGRGGYMRDNNPANFRGSSSRDGRGGRGGSNYGPPPHMDRGYGRDVYGPRPGYGGPPRDSPSRGPPYHESNGYSRGYDRGGPPSRGGGGYGGYARGASSYSTPASYGGYGGNSGYDSRAREYDSRPPQQQFGGRGGYGGYGGYGGAPQSNRGSYDSSRATSPPRGRGRGGRGY